MEIREGRPGPPHPREEGKIKINVRGKNDSSTRLQNEV